MNITWLKISYPFYPLCAQVNCYRPSCIQLSPHNYLPHKAAENSPTSIHIFNNRNEKEIPLLKHLEEKKKKVDKDIFTSMFSSSFTLRDWKTNAVRYELYIGCTLCIWIYIYALKIQKY